MANVPFGVRRGATRTDRESWKIYVELMLILAMRREGFWQSLSLGAVLIVLPTLAAYIPAMRGGFTWDDDDYLTKNPAMLPVEGSKQIWSWLVQPGTAQEAIGH
jgi:hypothetical protein